MIRCPHCFRAQCGWHEPDGICDGDPRGVPKVVEEMRPAPGRPVWQGAAYVVAFVMAVLAVWLLVGGPV